MFPHFGILPCTRSKTKDSFLKKTEFIYDEYYDCYREQEKSANGVYIKVWTENKSILVHFVYI
ncbi:hypothetical protein CYL18_04615 [Pradoshia eiseniae]|uniref:Uncharacterized protein n=1 Tax=Pradoshia eiseniae TaxID=2064768 RepID=A0A2S7N5D8_9BACI|nr:hypothetical protein CYL18_04615 [Pradoshia eiseniae]